MTKHIQVLTGVTFSQQQQAAGFIAMDSIWLPCVSDSGAEATTAPGSNTSRAGSLTDQTTNNMQTKP